MPVDGFVAAARRVVKLKLTRKLEFRHYVHRTARQPQSWVKRSKTVQEHAMAEQHTERHRRGRS